MDGQLQVSTHELVVKVFIRTVQTQKKQKSENSHLS